MHLLPAVTSGAPTLDQIHHVDALTLMRALPAGSIDCVVTSPPYYALRDYGVDGQIGLEDTPAQFIERLMQIFREVHRVLKPSGTVWVNLGDSYSGGGNYRGVHSLDTLSAKQRSNGGAIGLSQALGARETGLPAKSLMMIPARFAIAMQDEGWILRSDIIWHKPNPMPESVTDRPTKAHEMVYLFAKEGRYWYDADAVAEPVSNKWTPAVNTWADRKERGEPARRGDTPYFSGGFAPGGFAANDGKRNLRTVWAINPEPFSDAHFAVMPSRLVETCIKAGCPPGGVVLDMFMGSGTVAITARRLGRHFIGGDLNPEYVAMAKRRLSQTDPYQHRQIGNMKQLSMFASVPEIRG